MYPGNHMLEMMTNIPVEQIFIFPQARWAPAGGLGGARWKRRLSQLPPTRQTFSFSLTPLFFGKWDGDEGCLLSKMCTIKWGFV